MDYNFDKKRVIVTGAGKGIGRDISKTLAKYKARVIAISRTQSDLDSLKEENSSIEIFKADIADWDAIENVLADIGPVDYLINNAGVIAQKPVLEFTKQDVDSIIDINFKAAFHVSQVVAKQMIKNNIRGVIINLSSIGSKRVVRHYSAYSCSKAAMDMMTKTMALELGPNKIRVNSVNPSLVMTEMGRKTVGSNPEASAAFLSGIPLGRFVEVEEVTSAVMYLMSDKASMISGVTLPVDGGNITHFL